MSQTCRASRCEQNWNVFLTDTHQEKESFEAKRTNIMVYSQYNLKLRQNQLLNKIPVSRNITFDGFDPSKSVFWANIHHEEKIFGAKTNEWHGLCSIQPQVEVKTIAK